MNALASTDFESDWKVVRTTKRGKCAYQNLRDTSVSFVDFTQNGERLPAGFGRLDDLLDELENDPSLVDGLSGARKEVAALQLGRGTCILATFRLAQGLSQSDLATKLSTSQAAVSRLESGQQEPRLSMLRRLSEVLHVDLNTLGKALPS